MDLIDFTNCERDRRSDYGGSDRKRAFYYNGERYMVKFSERHEAVNDYGTSHVNNVLSEHVGSRIVASTGIPVHETILGTFNGELVVACKNFLGSGEIMHEFSWFLRTQYDSADISRSPRLDQIYKVISSDPDLNTIRDEAVSRYWDTFILDALIGNFDRHSGNWGYIIGADDSIRLAPVYDCGSCLYPNLSSDAMIDVLKSYYGIARRLYEFPKAALLVEGEKVGYYDMMASGYNADCSNALLRMSPKIDIKKINSIIDETPILSKERKRFYSEIIEKRYEYIIQRAYERVYQRDFDDVALSRIGMATFKNKDETMNEFSRALNEKGITSIELQPIYVKITDDKFVPGENFISLNIPNGTIYNSADIGGYRICPDEIKEHGDCVSAVFYSEQIKLHDKSGGYEIVNAADIKDAIGARTAEIAEERERERTIDKSVTRSRKKDVDIEL